MMKLLSLLVALLLAAVPARAVDLTKRTLGVGAAGELSQGDVTGLLSVRAALSPRVLAGAMLGFSAAPGVAFQPGLRFDWVVVPEERMNVSLGAALAMDLRSTGGLQGVTYRLGPSFELFTSDWPNLGFLLDFGFSGLLSGGVRGLGQRAGISTVLSPFGGAGLHYYF
jgi:hypothetical protein